MSLQVPYKNHKYRNNQQFRCLRNVIMQEIESKIRNYYVSSTIICLIGPLCVYKYEGCVSVVHPQLKHCIKMLHSELSLL